MTLTRMQQHHRTRFLERNLDRRQLRRMGCLMRQAQAAIAESHQARADLEKRKNCTVYLGVERGLRDPTMMLTVRVLPQEFRYYAMCESGNDFRDYTYYARMIGDEVEHKVTKMLLDFIAGESGELRAF